MSYFRLWTTDRRRRSLTCIGACLLSLIVAAGLLAVADASPTAVRSNRVLAGPDGSEEAAARVLGATPDEVLSMSILAPQRHALVTRDRQANGSVDASLNQTSAASVVRSEPPNPTPESPSTVAIPVVAGAASRQTAFAPQLPTEPTPAPTSTPVPPTAPPVPPVPTAIPTAVPAPPTATPIPAVPTAVPAPPVPTPIPAVAAAAPVVAAAPVAVAPPAVAPAQVAVAPAAIPRSGPPGVISQIPASAWRWLDAYGWTVEWRQGPGPGRVSEAQYSTSTIVIWYDTRRSDTTWAGAFGHELGHAVSFVHFGNQQMSEWNAMRGLSSWRWVPGTVNDFGVGEGDFAEAFMNYLLGHPVRSVGGGLSQQHRAWIAANTPF